MCVSYLRGRGEGRGMRAGVLLLSLPFLKKTWPILNWVPSGIVPIMQEIKYITRFIYNVFQILWGMCAVLPERKDCLDLLHTNVKDAYIAFADHNVMHLNKCYMTPLNSLPVMTEMVRRYQSRLIWGHGLAGPLEAAWRGQWFASIRLVMLPVQPWTSQEPVRFSRAMLLCHCMHLHISAFSPKKAMVGYMCLQQRCQKYSHLLLK